MKKLFKSVSVTLALLCIFGTISSFAVGKSQILDNDRFYAEIPEGFYIDNSFGEDHYYFSNDDGDEIEIYVEGNILLPDGIADTENRVINERIKDFIYAEDTVEFNAEKTVKTKVNGVTACALYGIASDVIFSEAMFVYVFTTKEALYIVSSSVFDMEEKNEPEFLTEFISSFLVNGTHYRDETLSVNHDFSKSEHYIDAIERDVLTQEYDEYNEGLDSFIIVFFVSVFILPVVTIILIVLYLKTRKKLKEYKEFFGPIDQARFMMNQNMMQTNYQSYQNNGQYFNNLAGTCNNQPQPNSFSQVQQPIQNNIPPEMTDAVDNKNTEV